MITSSPHRAARLIAAAALAALLFPSSVEAQGFGGGAGWFIAQRALRACGGDISRLCNAVAPGGGRIAQCLMAQENRLSPPCQEFIGKARSAQSAFFGCAADAQRLCADVEPGGGRIAACLGAKRDLISPDCAHALDEARQIFAR